MKNRGKGLERRRLQGGGGSREGGVTSGGDGAKDTRKSRDLGAGMGACSASSITRWTFVNISTTTTNASTS